MIRISVKQLVGMGALKMPIKLAKIIMVMLFMLATSLINDAQAGSRFTSQYGCTDISKSCVSSGTRVVDELEVHRDCWEWSYTKQCNYPSKDDCKLYAHCYALGDVNCLLKDSLGYCVNMQQEFSCESWETLNRKDETVRMGFEEKEGKEGLICKGIPCIDGHCVDKSYETNGEMMDSVSKLYAASEMKHDKAGNINLFAGNCMHCSKKPAGYSNCCKIKGKGWGKQLGAKCTKDENTLADMRGKNLCEYVGKTSTKKLGVTTVTKHHFCCFGNLLDKVVQREGRKQLGRSFGTGSNPDCRGLTLDEIEKINWDIIDFSEFIEDLKVKFAGKYKAPNQGEINETMKDSMGDLREYDNNPNNPENNASGWSKSLPDASEGR